MPRLLFWIALIAAAFWLWRRFKQPPSRPATPEPSSMPMVRCAHCGVHLPKDKALSAGEHWYCSDEHRRQDTHD